MKKKLVSFLLALAVLGTSCALAASLPFDDVKSGDWYYDAVAAVYDKGLMNGTKRRTFDPNGPTTRAAVVTILHRMAGSPDLGESSFPDVPSGSWYTRSVAWGASKGIVLGYGDGTFRPNSPVTREELAVILRRYAAYQGYYDEVSLSLSSYADYSKISPSAELSMTWCVQMGILTGVSKYRLAPTGSTTRAQLATVLTRFSAYMDDHA